MKSSADSECLHPYSTSVRYIFPAQMAIMIYSTCMDADENIMLIQVQQRLAAHSPRVIDVPLPKAAVLIPVTKHSEPKLILTRRASHMSMHSGEVAFPGGKQDKTDASLVETALRESQEEIGLMPQDVQVIGQTGTVISRFGIEVTPVVGIVAEDTKLVANTEELDRIFQVPVHFFLKKENLQYDRWQEKGVVYDIPRFQYQEYPIWGLTAIMLTEFLNITLDANITMGSPDLSNHFLRQLRVT